MSDIKTQALTRVKTFAITDPRSFDGDPYEVAGRSVRQAEAVASLLAECIDGARLMARNAQLEREIAMTGSCDAPAYDDSAEGRTFATIADAVAECERKLRHLAVAAAFNPKAR